MSPDARPRRLRADAEQSTARILKAANIVLAVEPSASLERIAQAAGLARATVHRRFSSRQALLNALVEQLNDRYLTALTRARVTTAPPAVALHRLTEIVLELKIGHPLAAKLAADPQSPGPAVFNPEIQRGLNLLFIRLHAAGEITAADPTWCRWVYLAVLHEIDALPADSPALGPAAQNATEELGARVDLVIKTVIGALGGPDKSK